MMFKYMAIAATLLGFLNLVQCSWSNGLREDIGRAEQECYTRIASMRANALEEIQAAEAAAREIAQQSEEGLRAAVEMAAEAEREADLRVSAVEGRMQALMDRLSTEDEEWATTFVPAYLLPPPSQD